jgi:hypothetical protein
MGSQAFTTYSRGKNVKDAYNRAVEQAEAEYGHQDGYSGQINSSAGYSDITREFKASKKSMNQFIEDQLDRLSKFDGARAVCIEEPVANNNKTKSQVEHVVTPGTKKWVLTYAVYRGDSRVGSALTKADAVKRAREYSEIYECTTTVKMERRLEKDAHALVAKVTYKPSSKQKEGRWVFFGWASC